MDQLLRLDQYLQRLFDAIDKHVGLANTIVILSADHGVMPRWKFCKLVELMPKESILCAGTTGNRCIENAIFKC